MRLLRRVPIFIGGLLLILFADPKPAGIVIGTVLIALGECLRIWAVGHLQKNEVLTVTGPYAYVKNPLYVGTILITTGFCILADNVFILAVATLAFCFHYIPYKKRVEGDRLRRVFGATYEDYDQKVPEYLPRRTPYSNKKEPWRVRLFIENSEGGILLLIIVGILLIVGKPYWMNIY